MIGDEMQLNDGTKVWIDSYSVSRTYDELEGDECDPRGNAFVLSGKHHVTAKIWPSIPAVILRKSTYEADLARPLPTIAVHAILRSLWKLDESEDGSHLAVTWLQENEWPLLSPENCGDLRALPWEEYALDFSY